MDSCVVMAGFTFRYPTGFVTADIAGYKSQKSNLGQCQLDTQANQSVRRCGYAVRPTVPQMCWDHTVVKDDDDDDGDDDDDDDDV